MEKSIRAFKAILIIAFFSILSLLLTVFLQIVLAAKFGAKIEMDAYFLAIAVPVIAIGFLTTSFEMVLVPFFKYIELTNSSRRLQELITSIFTCTFVILFVISLLGFIFAPLMIKYLALGFSAQAKQLSTVLFRIVMPSVLFGGLSNIMISIYKSQEKFAKPAFVYLVNNLILIVVFFLFYPMLGIKALALGMLSGYVVQFLMLLPILVKEKKQLFCLNLKDFALQTVGQRFLQILIGSAIFSLVLPFERLLASKLPEGSISYLGYASKVISLLYFLPTYAISTVLLPNLSGHFTMQNLENLRCNFSLGVRFALFITIPVCVLLFIFRDHVVYVILQRGNFDRVATMNVAKALFYYLGALLGVGLIDITKKGFVAIQNTFIPMVTMSVSFLFYVLIAPPLSKLFSFAGLAISLSITFLLSAIADLLILRRMLNGIKGKAILTTVYKVFISSLIMGAVAWFLYKNLTTSFVLENKFFLSLKLGISVLIGLGVYAIFCFLLKVEELTIIYNTTFATLVKKK